MQRVGYLLGPNVKLANLKWHTEFLETEYNININDFEIKKERVCENGYFSTCLVVCAIESEKTRVDRKLRPLKVGSIHYMLFSGINVKVRKNALHENTCINLNAKYKMITNVNILENVIYNKIKGLLRELLLKATHNGRNIMQGIE